MIDACCLWRWAHKAIWPCKNQVLKAGWWYGLIIGKLERIRSYYPFLPRISFVGLNAIMDHKRLHSLLVRKLIERNLKKTVYFLCDAYITFAKNDGWFFFQTQKLTWCPHPIWTIFSVCIKCMQEVISIDFCINPFRTGSQMAVSVLFSN